MLGHGLVALGVGCGAAAAGGLFKHALVGRQRVVARGGGGYTFAGWVVSQSSVAGCARLHAPLAGSFIERSVLCGPSVVARGIRCDTVDLDGGCRAQS